MKSLLLTRTPFIDNGTSQPRTGVRPARPHERASRAFSFVGGTGRNARHLTTRKLPRSLWTGQPTILLVAVSKSIHARRHVSSVVTWGGVRTSWRDRRAIMRSCDARARQSWTEGGHGGCAWGVYLGILRLDCFRRVADGKLGAVADSSRRITHRRSCDVHDSSFLSDLVVVVVVCVCVCVFSPA